MIDRRRFLSLSAAALCLPAVPARAGTAIHVHATVGCGCCRAWAALAAEQGHDVSLSDTADPEALKASLGVPPALASCHTAVADGYVFEGHVPLEALDAVLRDRPDIAGLAVPGMPMGSPGMGDDPSARFDVIAFGGAAGDGTVYYRAGRPDPFAG